MEESNKQKSFSGKIWNFLECNKDDLDYIRQKTDLSELNARILMNRGILSHTEIEAFLNTKLKNSMPDPLLLLDMAQAVSRIIKAIKSNEKILVFGDYDVDGVTSTFLIVKYLRLLGIEPKYQLPNRFVDGYGLSEEIVGTAITEGFELIIVVDSGVNSVNEVEEANKFGIDVVILDHHIQSVKELPKAVAVVNPNRIDQEEIGNSHIKHMCAAGVVFLFLIALQRELKNIGFFANKQEPDLHNFISIVTLGTLCDVMEIKGLNRAIVKFCLQQLSEYSPGINALIDVLKMDKIRCADDFSYFLGPVINAAGRVGDPTLALNLFLEEDESTANEIASKLVALNRKRKNIEKELLVEAILMIEKSNLHLNNGICVFGDNWHEGVIGIIAGKIKDKFQKPSFVISFDENGIGRGSARSVLGLHLGEVFEKAKEKGIIISGGGHAQAGGFAIHKNNTQAFNEFLNENININFENYLNIDYSLSAKTDLNKIYKEISLLEPFGKGIEKPIFCFKRLRIKSIKKISNNAHLMIFFSGEFDGNMRGVIFNVSSKMSLVLELGKNKDELLDVAAFIKNDDQFGSSLLIEDIKISET